MPSDRHIIDGVEHIATTNPGTPESPRILPVSEAAGVAAEPKAPETRPNPAPLP